MPSSSILHWFDSCIPLFMRPDAVRFQCAFNYDWVWLFCGALLTFWLFPLSGSYQCPSAITLVFRPSYIVACQRCSVSPPSEDDVVSSPLPPILAQWLHRVARAPFVVSLEPSEIPVEGPFPMLATLHTHSPQGPIEAPCPQLFLGPAVTTDEKGAERTARVGTDRISPVQYCDACNAACYLMNGRRRKLQARYEGFLLLKRLQGDTSSSRYLGGSLTPASQGAGSAPPFQKCCKPTNERRHSCGDVVEDLPIEEAPLKGITSKPRGPTRSLSHAGADDPLWEKLVNLPAGAQCIGDPILNNNPPSSVVETSCRGHKHTSSARSPSDSERGPSSHQRLSRKKSRSQDNLVGRRVTPSSAGPRPASGGPGSTGFEVLLNNRVIPPMPHLYSTLSRSEGNIHNVTSSSSKPLRSSSPEGGVPGAALRAERVEELAKLPKKFLDRVSDEVGQIVFYLERWREEYVVLSPMAIAVKSSSGKLETLLPYSLIEDVQPVLPCVISGQQHCLLIACRKSSLLMQASTSYVRDQWLHTILWKKNAYKYRYLLKTAKWPEVLLKELKNLIDLSLNTPLHDHSVCQVPLELASTILTANENWMSRQMNEEIIMTLAPLLENNTPSAEICSFFSRHCSDNPRSRLVIDMFTPVVSRILKHNVDFAKYPHVRRFVQDYIQALNSQNDGQSVVNKFVRDTHGNVSNCPHLRVLPNLVAVCTSAVYALLEKKKSRRAINICEEEESDRHLECYVTILGVISEYEDWRPGLAQFLQPVPFPDYALGDENFIRQIVPVIEMIGTDPRCQVHQMVLGPREQREGWINLVSPASAACCDKGEAWSAILQTLLSCCYKRKKFLKMLLKSLGSCMLLALRDNSTAQEILCLMLEWQIVEGTDQCMQMITTLQSTSSGKKKYQALCDRQLHLQEMQQKFGPRKLTLPPRSTDSDVLKLLSSGPFGNLEVLSLAFTRVTSACADQLIHLSSLRYLNLWATQFGDKGLQQICEHLHNLQMLNLCETPVTDEGLSAITALKNLRKLNLNSTRLSLQMFEQLKEALPTLQEIDVRYTDAW